MSLGGIERHAFGYIKGMHRLRREESRHDAHDLVEEAERFLAGDYLDIALRDCAEVPAAIWLSVLAHGDAVTIRSARERALTASSRVELEPWRRVLALLAHRIEELVERAAIPLAVVQRVALIPLELELLCTSVGPMTLYRLACAMLDEAAVDLQPRRS